jgi:hypothetical protein
LKKAHQATAEAREWQGRVNSLEGKLEQASGALRLALDNHSACAMQLTESRQLLAESAALCEELRGRIAALHASSSWQWMHPLRVMAGWLRQARDALRRL